MSVSGSETTFDSGCLTLFSFVTPVVPAQVFSSLEKRIYVGHKNLLERGHLPPLMPNLAPLLMQI